MLLAGRKERISASRGLRGRTYAKGEEGDEGDGVGAEAPIEGALRLVQIRHVGVFDVVVVTSMARVECEGSRLPNCHELHFPMRCRVSLERTRWRCWTLVQTFSLGDRSLGIA